MEESREKARRYGHTRAVPPSDDLPACCACVTCARETLGMCARLCVCAAVVCVSSACGSSFFFFGRGLRVLTLSYPERLSARATPLPKGELEHALRPQLAVLPQVSGEVGPEHTLLPPNRESTLTAGLSPLESLESHTQSGTDSRCHLGSAASRTCLLTQAAA